MKINVKEMDLIPLYATEESAGLDLKSPENFTIKAGEVYCLPLGISIEFEAGKYGEIYPRSGLGKDGLILANTVGIIDNDYKNEIVLMLYNRHKTESISVSKYQRVAQLIVKDYCHPDFIRYAVSDELNLGSRQGFGSTGKF